MRRRRRVSSHRLTLNRSSLEGSSVLSGRVSDARRSTACGTFTLEWGDLRLVAARHGLTPSVFGFGLRELLREHAVVGETIGVELTSLHGTLDRAAGFARVTTVSELAELGDLADVGEGVEIGVACFSERELTHSRRVDQEPPGLRFEELAVRRRVTTSSVLHARFTRPLRFTAEQGVDDGGFPDAGEPDEADGLSGDQVREQRRQAFGGLRVRGEDGGPRQSLAELLDV